jgi:glycosyltransferase involved in cell wall biosynthesis
MGIDIENTTHRPSISIVIPTYNASKYITDTVNSILNQDFDDYEIIIVDDNSTDNTYEIIKNLSSAKIKYYRLDQNHGGPSLPRNIGIKKSRSKYIAFCDSDDLFAPDRLSSSVDFLNKHNEVGMVFMNETKFDDTTGTEIGDFLKEYDRFHNLPKTKADDNYYLIQSQDAFSCLLYENYIMPSGVTVPSVVFKDVGLFDEELKNGDDGDMWLRISKKYPIGFINKIGFKYRIRANSISTRGPSLFENRIKVMNKLLASGVPAKLEKRCKVKISNYHWGIGYHYQKLGQLQKARHHYLMSLKQSINTAAIKGTIISMIGKRLFNALNKP